MPVHWTLILECSDCHAAIRYEDEKPDWHEESAVPELVAAANAYVAERQRGSIFEPHPPYVQAAVIGGHLAVCPPETRYYVECPACDGRAYRETGTATWPDSAIPAAPNAD